MFQLGNVASSGVAIDTTSDLLLMLFCWPANAQLIAGALGEQESGLRRMNSLQQASRPWPWAALLW
jgi:hypothetical protein